MNKTLFNAGLKSWALFITVLLITLIYGLELRIRGNQQVVVQQTGVQDGAEQLPSDHFIVRKEEKSDSALHSDSLYSEVRREVVLMGSQFVFIVDAPKLHALTAISEAAAAIKVLESKLSSWKPNSDISRLNEYAGRQPVKVSEETRKLLTLAQQISSKTNGAFDVTVGAVWDIWPFRNRHAEIPSQEKIDRYLGLVDAASMIIDDSAGTAYLPQKGMSVNLGGIGKGYAAHIAIETMKKSGIKHAAISAGGDLYLLGKKRSGSWLVELEHPRWPGRYIDRFSAGDVAVATSGDAKQYVEKNGQRYGHIIDPRTGNPANDCQHVTIITSSPTEADAYATAVYVMGSDQGMQWVEKQQGVEALIVDSEGLIYRSSGWIALTKKLQSSNTQPSNKDGV